MLISTEVYFLLNDLYRRLGKYIVLACVLAIFSGLMEGMAISLLLPVLNLLIGSDSSNGTNSFIHEQFVWLLHSVGLSYNLSTVFSFFTFALMTQYAVEITYSYFGSHSRTKYHKSWRKELTEKLLHCKWQFFVENNDSEVVSAIQQTSEKIGHVAWYFIQIFSLFFSMIIFLLLAVFISWQITLMMTAIGLILFPIMIPFLRSVAARGDGIAQEDERLSMWCAEVMSGAKYIKCVGGEDFVISKFDKINNSYADHSHKSFFFSSVITSLYQGLTIFMLVISLILSMHYLQASFVNVFMVLGLFSRLYPKYTSINSNLYMLKLNMAGLTYVKKLTDKLSQFREKSDINTTSKPIDSSISFNKVSVNYGASKVLEQVTFKMKRGNFLALVGSSGSGKTTILDAIMRLVEPSHGDIYIGKENILDLSLSDIRKHVGYVSQDTFLFNGSILENVVWDQTDYNEEDVIEALKLAGAYEFVSQFEGGLNHLIGDRGVKLSGGQKQRLGIARALYRKSGVLILDEPTSALDSVSEELILKTIKNLKNRVSIIMVAHRLSTVRDADYIYVLEKGKIIEDGRWDDLASRNSYFNKYYSAQALVE